MIKLWIKLVTDDKIKKDTIYVSQKPFSNENFTESITEICNSFDIPCPIILSKHLFQYLNFNTTTFYETDFVEPLNYDKMILENVIES